MKLSWKPRYGSCLSLLNVPVHIGPGEDSEMVSMTGELKEYHVKRVIKPDRFLYEEQSWWAEIENIFQSDWANGWDQDGIIECEENSFEIHLKLGYSREVVKKVKTKDDGLDYLRKSNENLIFVIKNNRRKKEEIDIIPLSAVQRVTKSSRVRTYIKIANLPGYPSFPSFSGESPSCYVPVRVLARADEDEDLPGHLGKLGQFQKEDNVQYLHTEKELRDKVDTYNSKYKDWIADDYIDLKSRSTYPIWCSRGRLLTTPNSIMNLRQAKPHFPLKESYSVVLPQVQAEELTSTDYAVYDDYRYSRLSQFMESYGPKVLTSGVHQVEEILIYEAREDDDDMSFSSEHMGRDLEIYAQVEKFGWVMLPWDDSFGATYLNSIKDLQCLERVITGEYTSGYKIEDRDRKDDESVRYPVKKRVKLKLEEVGYIQILNRHSIEMTFFTGTSKPLRGDFVRDHIFWFNGTT